MPARIQLATTQGKESALKALSERREQAKQEEQINNASLSAGELMYYYCKSCGLLADVLPENWDPRFTQRKKLCAECQALKDLGWLE